MIRHLKECWELLILDAAPPSENLGSLSVGDMHGDGNVEISSGPAGRGLV